MKCTAAGKITLLAQSLLFASLLIPLTESFPDGVPQKDTICNFRTDHARKPTDGDFKVIMVNESGAEIPCYNEGEYTTVRIMMTSNTHHRIRGFLLGASIANVAKWDLSPTRFVIKTEDVCHSYRTFSHSAKHYAKSIDLKFIFEGEKVETRTSAVFEYSEFVEDKRATFTVCPSPSPSPSPSPTPTQAPTPTPVIPSVTPFTCPKCEDIITDDFKCPKVVERYDLSINYTDETNGITYNCTKLNLRHFVFSSNCSKTVTCSTKEDSVCRQRTISITDCKVELEDRKRECVCVPYDQKKSTRKIKIKVPIERDSNYTCEEVSLL